jgi:hypothetical protein
VTGGIVFQFFAVMTRSYNPQHHGSPQFPVGVGHACDHISPMKFSGSLIDVEGGWIKAERSFPDG